jgi:hypothetical protein
MDGVEYSSEERPMWIEGKNEDEVDYDPDEGPSTFDGAGSIGWLFITCRKCCRTLAEGSEKDETEKPVPATEPIPEPIQSRMGF